MIEMFTSNKFNDYNVSWMILNQIQLVRSNWTIDQNECTTITARSVHVYHVYDLNDFSNCLTDNRNRTDNVYAHVEGRLRVDNNIEKHRIFVIRI